MGLSELCESMCVSVLLNTFTGRLLPYSNSSSVGGGNGAGSCSGGVVVLSGSRMNVRAPELVNCSLVLNFLP